MKWLPIETAPKDGTRFLAWSKEEGIYPTYWLECLQKWLGEVSPYTHWMPLPEPPEGK